MSEHDAPSSGFRKCSERLIHQARVISLWEGTFEGPDGSTFERDLVKHPGAVSVVAVHDDATVVLVRQYRAALDQMLLELPAGRRDVEGEPPQQCAVRELEEEVGLRAGRWELLATFAQSPGFCDEMQHVFLAVDLEEVPMQRHGIEETHMTVHRVPLSTVRTMVGSGAIVDGKTIIGLLLALDHPAVPSP